MDGMKVIELIQRVPPSQRLAFLDRATSVLGRDATSEQLLREVAEFITREPCQLEFGLHEHDASHTIEECERIRHDMSPSHDDGFFEQYNRGLEEEQLGRPVFPNEN